MASRTVTTSPQGDSINDEVSTEGNGLFDAVALLSAALDRLSEDEGQSEEKHYTVRLVQMALHKVEAAASFLVDLPYHRARHVGQDVVHHG